VSDASSRKSMVLERASARHLTAPCEFKAALTVYASPTWRGVEGDIWLARWQDTSRVYKHYQPDTAFYVDAASAMDCARQAALLGVAPSVTHLWPEEALIEMQHLGAGWRCAGLQDAANPDIRTQIIAAKKSVQAGSRYARTTSIFDEIRSLYLYCVESKAKLPRYIEAFLDFAHRAEQAISAVGTDQVPSHRDGNTSNLMIGPQQEVMLLDFDLAANADPFEDIGCYLAEMYECEPEARTGFEEWHGRFDEALFQRSVVYGMLDNLRWGLIATGMAATSPRRALEFAKYACWRYLRFEQHSQQSHASDRLRRLSAQ
jgi:hypothetical protein